MSSADEGRYADSWPGLRLTRAAAFRACRADCFQVRQPSLLAAAFPFQGDELAAQKIPFDCAEMIRYQNAVQMIYLVLNRAGRNIRHHTADHVAVPVQGIYPDPRPATYVSHNPRQAQASLFSHDFTLSPD
jgi:hypothetical protein